MIRNLLTTLVGLLCLSSLLMGGVVLEMESRDLPDGKGVTDRLYAQGEMLRVETGERGGPTVIFRDEALVILNDKERTYSRVDVEQAKILGAQFRGMMQQMQAPLDKLSSGNRGMPASGALPDIQIEKVGTEKIGEYLCQKYVIYQDGSKTGEIFSAPVEAVEESMDAFHAMARFTTQLLQAFRNTPLAELGNHPLRLMDQVEGFPVLSRQFRDGHVFRETTLKSAVQKDLDGDLFAPPDGYTQADLMSLGG